MQPRRPARLGRSLNSALTAGPIEAPLKMRPPRRRSSLVNPSLPMPRTHSMSQSLLSLRELLGPGRADTLSRRHRPHRRKCRVGPLAKEEYVSLGSAPDETRPRSLTLPGAGSLSGSPGCWGAYSWASREPQNEPEPGGWSESERRARGGGRVASPAISPSSAGRGASRLSASLRGRASSGAPRRLPAARLRVGGRQQDCRSAGATPREDALGA